MSDDDVDFGLDEEMVGGNQTDFGDFMGGIEEQLRTMMRESAKAPATAWEHWSAFSSAVDWTESWIRGLIGFHVVVVLFVLLTRKNVDCQTVAFFILGAIVYFSERVNTYASEHWQEFSKQNYFDKHGVFLGLMLSGPHILVLLFQLVNFLLLTSDALVKAKRLELRSKHKKPAEGAVTEGSQGIEGTKEAAAEGGKASSESNAAKRSSKKKN